MTLSYARFWRKDSKVALAVEEDGLEANIPPVHPILLINAYDSLSSRLVCT